MDISWLNEKLDNHEKHLKGEEGGERGYFWKMEISDVTIENRDLRGIYFYEAKLKNVIFENCDLSEAEFQESIRDNVEFINCKLDKADFRTKEDL